VRCALIAPVVVNLSDLYEALADLGVEPISTSELGAGAALTQGPLASLDCAIAVLPDGTNGQSAVTAATYLEIGIIIGQGLPILIIAARPDTTPPALAGLNHVYTDLANKEALKFHIGLFVKNLPAARKPPPVSASLASATINRYRQDFKDLLESHGPGRGIEFEQRVGDLLRECGAVIEERVGGFDQVDIAGYLPGFEKSLGPFIVEVKTGRLDSRRFSDAKRQLGQYVVNSQSGLGLLLYETKSQLKADYTVPLVIAMQVTDLLNKLETQSLGKVLLDARNRAIHEI
jgi:hypothetical protein